MASFIGIILILVVIIALSFSNNPKSERKERERYQLFRQDKNTNDIVYVLPSKGIVKFNKEEGKNLYNFLTYNQEFIGITNRKGKVEKLNILAKTITMKNGTINPNLSERDVKEWLHQIIEIEENTLPDID